MTGRRLACVAGAFIALVAPTDDDPAHAMGVNEVWGTTAEFLGEGELDGTPGRELLVGTADGLEILDAASGTREWLLPPTWSLGADPRAWIEDLDGDGRDEVVLTLYLGNLLGLVRVEGGGYVEAWRVPGVTPDRLWFADVTAGPGAELVVDDGSLLVVHGDAGDVLYDSSLTLGSLEVEEVTIADYTGEGVDDVLVRFATAPNLHLVADGVIAAVGEGVGSGPSRVSGFPNPTRGSTRLTFTLPRAGRASVRIYDAMGREVRVVRDGAFGVGAHALDWDGRDDAGREVAPGVYHAEIATADGHAVRRVVRVP